jgi:hypothetical protein
MDDNAQLVAPLNFQAVKFQARTKLQGPDGQLVMAEDQPGLSFSTQNARLLRPHIPNVAARSFLMRLQAFVAMLTFSECLQCNSLF